MFIALRCHVGKVLGKVVVFTPLFIVYLLTLGKGAFTRMMNKRRRGTRKKNVSNPLNLLVGAFLLVVFISYFATHDPLLFAMLIILLIGIAVAIVWLRVRKHARLLTRVRAVNDLLLLTPTQFELAMGELLETLGYSHVHHTGGGGDLAADLKCITPQGQQAVVQCKRYAPGNRIGSPEIQKFIGMITVHHQAQVGLFITTSSFTQPALSLAWQHHIQTIDGMQLARLIEQVRQQNQAMQQPYQTW